MPTRRIPCGYLSPAGARQARGTPIYETMEGWAESSAGARSRVDLSATSVKNVRRIEVPIEAPAALLSTSPERQGTILVGDRFAD